MFKPINVLKVLLKVSISLCSLGERKHNGRKTHL